MRRALIAAALLVLAGLIWLFGAGGLDRVALWAAAGQEEAQRAMAGALRALRAGDAGALAALWGLCFTYGFFHAAGPGHGKILIGGYGLGAQIPLARLSGLALAASLAQGLAAVLLVSVGVWLLGWGRQDLVGAAEGWFAPLSYGAIALVGLWLCLRGLFGLRLSWPAARNLAVAGGPSLALAGAHRDAHGGHARHHAHRHVHSEAHSHGSGHTHHRNHAHDDHGHGSHGHAHELHEHEPTHDDGAVCATCGHAHGPSLEQAHAVRTWRDAAALVGAIAIRPCTGALFVLILTFRWGLIWQGVSAVLAMALGVAAVTIAVGVAAVTLREGALRQSLARLSDGGAARALSLVECGVGALVALVAGGLMLQALSF